MTKTQYTILLLSVTLCWSTEMIFLKNIPAEVSSFAVLAMSNGIGTLILSIVFFKHIKNNIKKVYLLYGVTLAAMNILYNSLIMYSLKFIDSATGSFLISLTIGVIPLLMIFMKRKVTRNNIIGIILIVLGIVLSRDMSSGNGRLAGTAIMLIVCFIRAYYIIKMNDFAKNSDSAVLSVAVGGFVAVISFILWFIVQPKTFFALEYNNAMLSSVFTEGYFICGYAVLINIIAQKYASPTSCSAIYSLQVVFAIIFAAVIPEILGEKTPLTPLRIFACVIIVVGALISEIDFKSLIKLKKRRLDYERYKI